jgi:hypothetical protein
LVCSCIMSFFPSHSCLRSSQLLQHHHPTHTCSLHTIYRVVSNTPAAHFQPTQDDSSFNAFSLMPRPPAEIHIGCGDAMGRTGVQQDDRCVLKKCPFIFLVSYVNPLSMYNVSMMRLAAPSHPICLDMYRYPRNILMEPFPS